MPRFFFATGIEGSYPVNPVGLFDLDRRERPVARAFRQLVRDYGQLEAWDSALTYLERSERSLERPTVSADGQGEPARYVGLPALG